MMNTTNFIKRGLLAGIAAVTLFTSVMAPTKAVYAGTYDKSDMVESNESINMADWMRYMPNDVQISRLNMPGSHDAGMYNADTSAVTRNFYETQSVNLYKQMEAGSRVFDIRLGTMYMGERHAMNLIVHHGEGLAKLAEKGEKDDKKNMHLRLWNVFEAVNRFLDAHRDETIVLYLQDHGKTSKEAKSVLDEFKKVLNESSHYYRFHYYGQGEEVPTLGEVRGRCVIIYDENNRTKYEDHDSGNHCDKIKCFDHMMDYAESNVYKPTAPDRFIQEKLENPPYSSDDEKAGYKEGDPNVKMVYMSAQFPPMCNPSQVASHVLKYYADGREWKKGVRYGWVMMDYVGASEDSAKVIKKIVYSNEGSTNYTVKINNVNENLTLKNVAIVCQDSNGREWEIAHNEMYQYYPGLVKSDDNSMTFTAAGLPLYAPNGLNCKYMLRITKDGKMYNVEVESSSTNKEYKVVNGKWSARQQSDVINIVKE